MPSEVVRVDTDLVDLARLAGQTMGRSIGAQLSHWARLGRAVENIEVPVTAIGGVIEHQASVDALDEPREAAEHWRGRVADAIASLDLAREFQKSGEAFAELEEDGELAITLPRSPVRRVPERDDAVVVGEGAYAELLSDLEQFVVSAASGRLRDGVGAFEASGRAQLQRVDLDFGTHIVTFIGDPRAAGVSAFESAEVPGEPHPPGQ